MSDLRRETADAVSVTFDIPPALAADYAFDAGQYLTLRATVGGEDMRRSYSICSGPDDGELRIAVKRVEGGAFSTWANEALAVGHSVHVMTPTGRFGTSYAEPDEARIQARVRVSPPGRASPHPVDRPRDPGPGGAAASSCSTATSRGSACCSAKRWRS